MKKLPCLMLAVVIFTMCKSIKPDAPPPKASNNNEASVVANETISNQTGKVVEESTMSTNTNADSIVVSGQELVPELDTLKRDKLPDAIIAELAALGRMKPIKNTEWYTNGQNVVAYEPVVRIPKIVSDLFPDVVFYYVFSATTYPSTSDLTAYAFKRIWSPTLAFNLLLEKQGGEEVDIELKIEALMLLYFELAEGTTVVVKPAEERGCFVAQVRAIDTEDVYLIKTIESKIVSFDHIEGGIKKFTVILYD